MAESVDTESVASIALLVLLPHAEIANRANKNGMSFTCIYLVFLLQCHDLVSAMMVASMVERKQYRDIHVAKIVKTE